MRIRTGPAAILTLCLGLSLCSSCRNFEVEKEHTLVFQEGRGGYDGTADTYVIEWPPGVDNNAGRNPYMEITQVLDPNDNKWGLVRFELTGLPSGVAVVEATLELYLLGLRGGSDDKEVDVHEVTEDWEEGEGTGDPDGDPGAAGVDWMSRPAFDPTRLDEVIVHDDAGSWYRFDVTAAARHWLEEAAPNLGVYLLEDSPTGDGTKRFASSENPDPSLRPRLTIVVKY